MDNSLIEMIIKILGNQNRPNQTVNTQQNPSLDNYPKEAFSQVQSHSSANDNNLLPLLMSFLKNGGEDNPLLKAFSSAQSTKKEDKKSSPNNEILL